MARTKLTVAAAVHPVPTVHEKVEQYLDLKTTIDRLQLELERVKADLKADAFQAKKEGRILETETHTVMYVESESVHISKTKLLELGVKPSLVAKATTVTPYAYPRVIEKKESRLARKET